MSVPWDNYVTWNQMYEDIFAYNTIAATPSNRSVCGVSYFGWHNWSAGGYGYSHVSILLGSRSKFFSCLMRIPPIMSPNYVQGLGGLGNLMEVNFVPANGGTDSVGRPGNRISAQGASQTVCAGDYPQDWYVPGPESGGAHWRRFGDGHVLWSPDTPAAAAWTVQAENSGWPNYAGLYMVEIHFAGLSMAPLNNAYQDGYANMAPYVGPDFIPHWEVQIDPGGGGEPSGKPVKRFPGGQCSVGF